jgi:hypothetical protein
MKSFLKWLFRIGLCLGVLFLAWWSVSEIWPANHGEWLELLGSFAVIWFATKVSAAVKSLEEIAAWTRQMRR